MREQFELDPAYIHLGLLYLASHPRPVRQAIERLRRRLDQNPFLTVERSMFENHLPKAYDGVRAALARYTGADAGGHPPRGRAHAAMFSPGGFQAYEHHWAVPAAIEFTRASARRGSPSESTPSTRRCGRAWARCLTW